MKQRIEVEHRARFNRRMYARLRSYLRRYARSLGQDDKEVFFYVSPKVLYKVVRNISERTAKLVLKKNRIERASSFDETEISISPSDIEKANEFVQSIPRTKLYHDIVRRENFLWHGVEIALKYSRTWGYHAEFEILISSARSKTMANRKIQLVADSLGVRLMTTNDVGKFLQVANRSKR